VIAPRPDDEPWPDWRTRDGRVIKVADMDDRHLDNAIKFMERQWSVERLQKLVRYRALVAERDRRLASLPPQPLAELQQMARRGQPQQPVAAITGARPITFDEEAL